MVEQVGRRVIAANVGAALAVDFKPDGIAWRKFALDDLARVYD